MANPGGVVPARAVRPEVGCIAAGRRAPATESRIISSESVCPKIWRQSLPPDLAPLAFRLARQRIRRWKAGFEADGARSGGCEARRIPNVQRTFSNVSGIKTDIPRSKPRLRGSGTDR